MLQKIEFSKRYRASHGWLTSYHLFSFADYFDEANMHFGTLRVFNDDYISGKSGFPMHPHKDMEIVTLMHKGVLTHGDSMENKRTLKAGDIQAMSAGNGVVHSEYNYGDEEVHLYQLWFIPRSRGRGATYKDVSSVFGERGFSLCVSGYEEEAPLSIDSPVRIFWYNDGGSVVREIKKDKGIFVYVYEGEVIINDVTLKSGDQIRVIDEEKVSISGSGECIYIEVEMIL